MQGVQDSKPLPYHVSQPCTVAFSAQLINVIDHCQSFNPLHLNNRISFALELSIYRFFEGDTVVIIFEVNGDVGGVYSEVGANAFVAKLRIWIHLYQKTAQRSHFAAMGAKFVD